MQLDVSIRAILLAEILSLHYYGGDYWVRVICLWLEREFPPLCVLLMLKGVMCGVRRLGARLFRNNQLHRPM